MLTTNLIIRVTLNDTAMAIARARDSALKACIDGNFTLRDADRQQSLPEDELVGRVGTLAWHLNQFGHPRRYLISRYYADQRPVDGAGDPDDLNGDRDPDFCLPVNANVMGSLMRGSRNPLDYPLAVRPGELHANHVYILALVEDLTDTSATVHLVGWATTDMLPKKPDDSGRFEGAYVLPAAQLYPLMADPWGPIRGSVVRQ